MGKIEAILLYLGQSFSRSTRHSQVVSMDLAFISCLFGTLFGGLSEYADDIENFG